MRLDCAVGYPTWELNSKESPESFTASWHDANGNLLLFFNPRLSGGVVLPAALLTRHNNIMPLGLGLVKS